jgi:transcriptional regulator with XRE-family HTH domain
MEREISPILNKAYGGGNLHRIYEATAALNGTGLMASDLVNALAELTEQKDLHLLTLLPWSSLLPSRRLLRHQRAWCPVCFDEWLKSDREVIEPLLWSLDVVQFCPQHYQLLQQTCPHCHQENLPLAWRSRPGYCSKCLQWLGSSNSSNNELFSDYQLEWLIWVANSIGELIAAAPELNTLPGRSQIIQSLKTYVNITTGGNIAEFARRVHLPRNSVWLWYEGKNQPQLETLLRICYCLNISLLEFLMEKTIESDQLIMRSPVLRPATLRSEAKKISLKQLEQKLETILLNDEFPSPSMEEVSRRLEYDRRTIFRHFPKLCNSISAKYLNCKKAAQLSAVDQCCEEVRQAVVKLHRKGLVPSEGRVAELLSKPGYLRYEVVRAALKKARLELEV